MSHPRFRIVARPNNPVVQHRLLRLLIAQAQLATKKADPKEVTGTERQHAEEEDRD